MGETGEAVTGNLERFELPLYRQATDVLGQLFENPELGNLEMITIGGSFATGRFRPDDDLDMYILIRTLPDDEQLMRMNNEVIRHISAAGLTPHIGAYIDRTGNSVTFSKRRQAIVMRQNISRPEVLPAVLLSDHPDTPYIARNENAVSFWTGVIPTAGNPAFAKYRLEL
ncbi:hypothetical protein A2Z33_05930 [Candidatus Gottesmanbacteria bacterium RBG_16_52_11]|uniref:Uncharacterized protein n=1 Tax=Candidatus Gottesmanbacteria bacterium RBG_16_52_11 TaxID=1798374 RepID=A0A1F5YXB3_9BACT|nr:MAG: hypothetical protein A2Z33_05930 [Candidatus Gottesmanbacteria bacterium RBG_16_52_11]